MKKPMKRKEHIQRYCLYNMSVFQPAREIAVHLYYIRISSLAVSLREHNSVTTFAIQAKAHTSTKII